MTLLGKIKIYELAKEINVESKKLLELAIQNGIDAKSHLSSISEEESQTLKNIVKGNSSKKQEKQSQENKKEKAKKNTETPVIIRREVIINDEETKNKELDHKKKAEQARKNDVGFINQNRNKDYNMVYRNKPTKPLTMNELFGIGKKQEKTVEDKPKIEEKQEVEEQTESKQPEIKSEVKVDENRSAETRNTNNYEKRNTNNNYNNRNNTNNYNNRNNSYNNRNNNNYNNRNNNNYNNNNRNNFNRNNNNRNYNNNYNNGNNNQRPDNRNNSNNGFQRRQGMDDRRIDKKIKNIMEIDLPEKENVRDYNNNNNKNRDRMKQNQKMSDQRQPRKNRKNGDNDFNSGKLNNLKKQNKLSNMFNEGEMLDYYDLSTERGRRGKKRNKPDENRVKQKIFKLTEITIPETITVKDLATEMKITSSEVIKKLFNLGVMATINNEVDFDTAYLIAQEFGINAIKKNIVTDEDILIEDRKSVV